MPYSQLTRGQRCRVEALKASGFTQAQIAERVGVHQSTISREAGSWAETGRSPAPAATAPILRRRRRCCAVVGLRRASRTPSGRRSGAGGFPTASRSMRTRRRLTIARVRGIGSATRWSARSARACSPRPPSAARASSWSLMRGARPRMRWEARCAPQVVLPEPHFRQRAGVRRPPGGGFGAGRRDVLRGPLFVLAARHERVAERSAPAALPERHAADQRDGRGDSGSLGQDQLQADEGARLENAS